MFPSLLIQIAVLVIAARSAYMAFKLGSSIKKPWLEIAYHIAVGIICLNILL